MKEKMAKKKKRKQTLETVDAQKVNYDILHTSIWKIFQYGLVLDCIWSVLFHILNKGSWMEVLNIIMRRPGLLLLAFVVFETLYGLGFIKVSDAVLVIVIDVAVAIVVLLDFWTRGIIILCALPIVVGTILKNERLIFLQALISGGIIWLHEQELYRFTSDAVVGSHPALNFLDGVFGVMIIYVAVKQTRKYTQMLDDQSTIDSLTHLFNHETFYEALDAKLVRQKEKPEPLCVMIADIDNFKKVNDTFGHAYGDKVLKVLADIFLSNASERCFVSRYGGEEFAMIMEMDKGDALTRAQQIRKEFQDSVIETEDGIKNSFTVSIGVAEFTDEYKTSSQFFEKADTALYKAKKTGKNKVCI